MRDSNPDFKIMQRITRKADEDARGLTPSERDRFKAAEERLLYARPDLRDKVDLSAPPGVHVDTFEAAVREEATVEVFDRWLRHGHGSVESFGVGPSVSTGDVRDWMSGAARHDAGIFARGQRALGTVAGAAGGFAVPQSFADRVIEAQKQVGGLLAAPITRVATDRGDDLPWPVSDGTDEVGEQLDENTQATELDPDFDQRVLKAWTYSSKIVRVSNELLADSAFDVQQLLAGKLGTRLGRAIAPALISGDGFTEPQGILTNPSVTVGFTVSGTNSFVYTDWVEFIHSIDPVYRNSPSTQIILSDGALKAARLITISSTDSEPIYQPGLSITGADIFGEKWRVDAEMPAMTTGNKVAIYGDLSHYVFRVVRDITLLRLTERYSEFGQTGFLAFQRVDGAFVAADSPVKAMLTS